MAFVLLRRPAPSTVNLARFDLHGQTWRMSGLMNSGSLTSTSSIAHTPVEAR